MAIMVWPLGAEYEAFAAWTGEPAEAIRRQVEDDHEGRRDHWLAWREGGEVVGAVHPVLTLDGKLRLFFDRTLPEAYGPIVAMVDGPCQTTVDGEAAASLETLRGLGFVVSRADLLLEIPVARTEYAASTVLLGGFGATQTGLELELSRS